MEDTILKNLSEAISKFLNVKREAADYIPYFRGHGKKLGKEDPILPYLLRTEDKSGKKLTSYEFQIKTQQEAEKYQDRLLMEPGIFSHELDIVNLAKMQHYLGDTRLLDITKNPLVALFMCCDNSPDSDGEVVAMAVHKSDIKRMDDPEITRLTNKYLLKHEPTSETNQPPMIYLVKTPKDNPRIRAQQGEFLIFDNGSNLMQKKGGCEHEIHLLNHKIVVPKDFKSSILEELKFIGVSKNALYPELQYIE